ncbi:MAG TPA: YdcF family protein [Clostridia bacterium]|nr:YdcF family protein [Clostridia bacterium]
MNRNYKKWFYYLLLMLGMLGVIDTILVSIYTGINVGSLFPGIAGLIIIVYIYIGLWVRKGRPVIQDPLARRLVCAMVVCGVIFFASLEVLITYSSSLQEDVDADYIIILGGGLHEGEITPTLQERLQKGLEYMEKYPDTDVIVSGGKGFGESITEAEAMKRYLISKGIAAGRILEEDRATSTMENFVFSRELLQNIEGRNTTRIVVATSDFHMLRAKFLARRVGFEPYGITSSTPASVRMNSHIREYFALVKSFLFDR